MDSYATITHMLWENGMTTNLNRQSDKQSNKQTKTNLFHYICASEKGALSPSLSLAQSHEGPEKNSVFKKSLF